MRRTVLAPIIALALIATPLDAQDAPSPPAAGDKSPMAARIIGIVPGAGHMYAGETARGFAYMGGTIGVAVLGTMMLAAGCISSLGEETCDTSGAENVVTAAILGVWGWSIYDAGRAAQRTNARHRLRVSLIVAPGRSVQSPARDGRAVKLGLSVATR
jgi:hypothetical protein